jgi:hypothetical protein
MQHAEHFLSRLVRLADDEIKLALALYHDSGWVREILLRRKRLARRASDELLHGYWNP